VDWVKKKTFLFNMFLLVGIELFIDALNRIVEVSRRKRKSERAVSKIFAPVTPFFLLWMLNIDWSVSN
jgi:hypothetical protein